MNRLHVSPTWLVGLLASVTFGGCTLNTASDFHFLATGDVPYDAVEDEAYRRLLEQASAEEFSFLVHVGDIKGQGEPCTNERFEQIRDLFQRQPWPVIYTPGDNEWTDCHGIAAGGFDPVERLEALRRLFFADESVLRLEALGVRPEDQDTDAGYPENFRFFKNGVLFVVAHVTGSGNGLNVQDPNAMKEYGSRSRATADFLEKSLELAASSAAPGVAIIIHANPGFEKRKGEGFLDFINTLERFLRTYDKPVVCIHGDSHTHRIDKPLRDNETERRFLHFTRMEVFGSPKVAGVVVTVDVNRPEVFSYEPYYLETD